MKLKRMSLPRFPEQSLQDSVGQGGLLAFAPETTAELLLSRSSDYALHPDHHVEEWIAERMATPHLQVEPIPLREISRWQIEPATGNLRHESGKFFTLTGVKVRHRTAAGEIEWDQPIIDQPEVGILGILAKKINGVLHFCLQAKEEPGNLNSVQLSPTVQATYSNYTRVHGGSPTPFVEYFLAPPRDRLMFAKLQTEDGGRFLFKSNRNMIVRVGDDELPEVPAAFIWLTLRQIAALMGRNNLLHACTRSILSSLILPRNGQRPGRHKKWLAARPLPEVAASIAEAVQWLDDQKAANHIFVDRQGLNALEEWGMDREGYFSHREGRFFRVVGIHVSSAGREVTTWSQPILESPQPGIIGLLMKNQGGERHFLMQAKSEVGNRAAVQLGPTVQFTPGNYAGNEKLTKPFLFEEFSGNALFPAYSESFQSEEGARFFREKHLHRILSLPYGVDIDLPPEFRWLSESELRFFLHLGEQVNSCARSVLSCLI